MNDRQIDQVLVERAQKGEQKAFEMLMSKYQRRLIRLVSRFVNDEHEVNDVAQEAMIRAYRALPNFRGESAFYTWLYRITINTAKNFLVTLGKQPFVSAEAANEDGDRLDLSDQIADYHTPEAEMINREILQTVESTISHLSYEEIATIMDCPIGTVRSRIFRAREVIAKDLRPLLETSEKQRW